MFSYHYNLKNVIWKCCLVRPNFIDKASVQAWYWWQFWRLDTSWFWLNLTTVLSTMGSLQSQLLRVLVRSQVLHHLVVAVTSKSLLSFYIVKERSYQRQNSKSDVFNIHFSWYFLQFLEPSFLLALISDHLCPICYTMRVFSPSHSSTW